MAKKGGGAKGAKGPMKNSKIIKLDRKGHSATRFTASNRQSLTAMSSGKKRGKVPPKIH